MILEYEKSYIHKDIILMICFVIIAYSVNNIKKLTVSLIHEYIQVTKTYKNISKFLVSMKASNLQYSILSPA